MEKGHSFFQNEEKMVRTRESICVGEEQEDIFVQLRESVSCVGKEM